MLRVYQIDIPCPDWTIYFAKLRDKAGFITPFGCFPFKRMPFGLLYAPSTFQRLVDTFKSGQPGLFVLCNVTIMFSPFEPHMSDLQHVFNPLILFKLHVNQNKCSVARSEIKYLEHIIYPDGSKPRTEKVAAILKILTPKNLRQPLIFIQTVFWF